MREMKTSVQARWSGWRQKHSGISERESLYKMEVRPAVMYSLRMMSLAKTQEAKLEVAELKVILRNRFINDYVRENAPI